jgi:hypothetical protein
MIEKSNSKVSPKDKTLIQMTKEVSQPAAGKYDDKMSPKAGKVSPKAENLTEPTIKKEEPKLETKVEIQR